MIDQKDCLHERLVFASGDYYVTCAQCGAYWMRKHNGSQPEYGYDHQGRKIGAAPEHANVGAGSILSGNLRVRLSTTSTEFQSGEPK